MKEIKAIIKPFVLEKVLSRLDSMEDLPGVTISQVMGWGHFPERHEEHDIVQAGHGLSKKVKLELVVKEQQVKSVVDAVAAAAHTGNPGDGKIFVYDVGEVVRIRTGEIGPDAI